MPEAAPLDPDYCTVEGGDLERLQRALVNAFNAPELEQLVRFELSEGLYQSYTSRQLNEEVQVFELLTALGRRGATATLLRGARRRNPGNRELLEVIRQVCPAAMNDTAGAAGPVVTALQALKAKVKEPVISGPLQASRDKLEALAKNLAVLQGYKSLHDDLQKIQLQLFIADVTPTNIDPAALNRLETALVTAAWASQRLPDDVKSIPEGTPERAREEKWIKILSPAMDKLSNAVGVLDYPAASQAFGSIRSVLRYAPANVNGALTAVAESLPIDLLASAIYDIHQKLAEGHDAKAVLGLAFLALQDLLPRLRGQVAQHNLWQETENQLAAADDDIGRGSVEDRKSFKLHWDAVTPMIDSLWALDPSKEWVTRSKRTRTAFEGAAGDPEKPITKEERDKYRSFRIGALDQFYRVDGALITLCGEVLKVSEPLKQLLESIPHGS
jgi:hypothetical protein